MCSQIRNCAASVPIPTFMWLWGICIFSGSVHTFGCSKIEGPIQEIYKSLKDIQYCMSVGIGRQNIIILFWNNEAAQFHFICSPQPFYLLIFYPLKLNCFCSTILWFIHKLRYSTTLHNFVYFTHRIVCTFSWHCLFTIVGYIETSSKRVKVGRNLAAGDKTDTT